MTIDEEKLKKEYRAGWILVIVAAVHICAFWLFNIIYNHDTKPTGWDLGDIPIVPASSIEADGYYHETDTRWIAPAARANQPSPKQEHHVK